MMCPLVHVLEWSGEKSRLSAMEGVLLAAPPASLRPWYYLRQYPVLVLVVMLTLSVLREKQCPVLSDLNPPTVL